MPLAGVTVIATVSDEPKAQLARAADAHHVVNYKEGDAADQVRRTAPDGVDFIVEVAPGRNTELDLGSLKERRTISRRGCRHGTD